MSYSDRLVELPFRHFAVAIATVILPVMSRQMKAQPEAATATLRLGYAQCIGYCYSRLFSFGGVGQNFNCLILLWRL